MRRLLLFENFKSEPEIFMDERDGNEYKTIRVNDTTWMAENFRYDYSLKAMDKNMGLWNMLDIQKPVVKKSENPKYGSYYNFAAAQMAKPKGWTIPTEYDWQELIIEFAEGKTGSEKYRMAFKNLASPEYENERFNRGEMGLSGFNALPAGCYSGNSEHIKEEGEKAFFWGLDATRMPNYRLYYYFTDYGSISAQGYPESTLMSVRYIKKK
jgi:uncharacterized protein (TIGR02145 family)